MPDQITVLHGIQNDTDFISQITQYGTQFGINRMRAFAAGHEYPLAQFILDQNITAPFSSTQIGTILGLTGMGFYDMSDNNTDVYFKSAVDGASRAANDALSHYRYRAAKACLVPQSISASQGGGLAEITCLLFYLFDGTNAPLVAAGSVAVSGTSSFSEGYGMGPIELNTTRLSGVQSWSLDFGIGLKVRASDGDQFPTWLSLESSAPTLTFSCYSEKVTTYGISGASGTGVEFWLRAKSKTGNVADGTSSHIKFAGTTSAIYPEEQTGGNNDDGMTSIAVELIGADHETVPASVTVGTTIA